MPSRKALQSERDADYAELRDSSDRHIAAAIGLVENASATVVSAIRARNALASAAAVVGVIVVIATAVTMCVP